jgi:quercetin dioxygenase-like cupin family protein
MVSGGYISAGCLYPRMEFAVAETEDVPITDLSEIDELPPDLDIRPVSRELGCENLVATIWYFDEGEEINYHAHEEQEEFFYVIDGRFSLKLGRSGEEEYREVGPGAFYAAAPLIGHGHRCISDGGGTVLAIGAPNVTDPGINPHDLDDEEIDEALD